MSRDTLFELMKLVSNIFPPIKILLQEETTEFSIHMSTIIKGFVQTSEGDEDTYQGTSNNAEEDDCEDHEVFISHNATTSFSTLPIS